jgi:hypothetical protein
VADAKLQVEINFLKTSAASKTWTFPKFSLRAAGQHGLIRIDVQET